MKTWTRAAFVMALGLIALGGGATLGARDAVACETCLIPPPQPYLAWHYYTQDGQGSGGFTCQGGCSAATGFCCSIVIVRGP